MANLKISELQTASALDGTESNEVVQAGTNRKSTTREGANLAIITTQTSGTAIQFDKPRTYGTIASPESGNITYNSSGAIVGMVQLLIHALYNATPTFGAEFILLDAYTPTETNYIYMELAESGKIITSIRTAV